MLKCVNLQGCSLIMIMGVKHINTGILGEKSYMYDLVREAK